MGFNTDEVYQSNSEFLKAEDIGANFWTATICNVDLKNFDDGSRKLFILFNELDKGLVLNKTNSDTIGELYGKNTDGWLGKQVMLFTMPVDYQGKKVQAIRVRAPASQQSMPARQPGQMQPQANTQSYAQASGANQYDERNAPPPTSAEDYFRAG